MPLFSNYTLLYFVLVLSDVFITNAKVMVVLNSNSKVKFENQTETILENSEPYILLKCLASYPTEIVWDSNKLSPNGMKQTGRNEWTDRIHKNTVEDTSYEHTAWLLLIYSQIVEDEVFLCRSVMNHSDNVIVALRPELSTGLLYLTNRSYENDTTNWTLLDSTNNSEDCSYKIIIGDAKDRYYWQCQTNTGSWGTIQFNSCPHAPFCANELRISVIMLKEMPLGFSERHWSRMDVNVGNLPGVAVCSFSSQEQPYTTRRVVEYFFSGFNEKEGRRKLQLSWIDINLEDMIWFTPAINRSYYTRDILETSCIVPNYGFAFDPVLILKHNSSKFAEERSFVENIPVRWFVKKFKIDFSIKGNGLYNINCLGPVWNTTEWANLSATITVKESIPPYFLNSIMKLNFNDGDSGKEIHCNPLGDPQPRLSWNTTISKVRYNGNVFILDKVTHILHDGSRIYCTAFNDYGETATKAFIVAVNKKEGSTTLIIVLSTSIVIFVFIGLAIFIYCKYIKLGRQFANLLSYIEIKEFREGKQKSTRPEIDKESALEDDAFCVDYLPYNDDFEIAKANFLIDFNNILGEGQYGIVYKGTIKSSDKQPCALPVAVKTVRKDADISYFKALMSELKILAYIGRNDHVVSLIGANTSNIKNRVLYVGVEYCQTSLLKHLKNNKHNFKDMFQLELSDDKDLSAYVNCIGNTMSTFDLIQWAGEVASGMDFISMKKVIHGDLAARNILLTKELNAKICDFGLARQLVDYNYIKTTECPLPWKWLAIESLSEMKFSTQSDVWAYGITLWEIFSIGNIPYSTMAWNMNFVDQLINGLRLSKPKYASKAIYDQMIACWTLNPKDRLTFCFLKDFFQSLQASQSIE